MGLAFRAPKRVIFYQIDYPDSSNSVGREDPFTTAEVPRVCF